MDVTIAAQTGHSDVEAEIQYVDTLCTPGGHAFAFEKAQIRRTAVR